MRPALPEELPQEARTFLGAHAADHLQAMVQDGHGRQVDNAPGRPRPAVVRAEDQRADARVEHGADTHGARLQGDVAQGSGKAIVADALSGPAQCEDFRMGRRITQADGPVVGGAQDVTPAPHHHGAHGNLGGRIGGSGLGQGKVHEAVVIPHEAANSRRTPRWKAPAHNTK
jgi:hypothetical protein